MTAATLGNWKVKIGTNASPQVLTEIEEVLDLDGFGESSELVDVTNFDTTLGQKEFIGGLSEGDEFSVTANYISTAASHQAAIRADQTSTRLFDIRYLGTSPNQKWTGEAVLMGWRIIPSLDEQNQVEFTFKISDAIAEAGGS